MKLSNNRRRGAALLAALVLLTVIVIMFGAMLQQLAATQRAARNAGRKLQAQWLAESALERAIAKRSADPKYAGETWKTPAADSGEQGVAEITIQNADDQTTIEITADFPDHPLHRARVQLKRPIQ